MPQEFDLSEPSPFSANDSLPQEEDRELELDNSEEDDRDEYIDEGWTAEEAKVKANPMLHRDAIYLHMLCELRANEGSLMWSPLAKGDSGQVSVAKQHGWDRLDDRGKIKLLLRCIDFNRTKPGIYCQEWYANPGDPYPPHAGGDFSLDEDKDWRPLSELGVFLGMFGGPLVDPTKVDRNEIADRMYGWADIEHAWVGAPNNSDWEDSRPYNWARYWVVNFGPPILVDPHYVMHMRGTPLAPPQCKPLFEVTKMGKVWWVSRGPTFARKEWLKAEGMRWDPTKKIWRTGRKAVAESVARGPLEDTTPGSWEFYHEHEQPGTRATRLYTPGDVDITDPMPHLFVKKSNP